MTWFEFRENDSGSWDVVMLKGHPEDETNKETIVATDLEEVEAEDAAAAASRCGLWSTRWPIPSSTAPAVTTETPTKGRTTQYHPHNPQ